jgi:hypothetical protein
MKKKMIYKIVDANIWSGKGRRPEYGMCFPEWDFTQWVWKAQPKHYRSMGKRGVNVKGYWTTGKNYVKRIEV